MITQGRSSVASTPGTHQVSFKQVSNQCKTSGDRGLGGGRGSAIAKHFPSAVIFHRTQPRNEIRNFIIDIMFKTNIMSTVIDKKVGTQNDSGTTFEQCGWESIKISFSSQTCKEEKCKAIQQIYVKGNPMQQLMSA